MVDPNILDIDSHLFKQLETILENKSARDSFLAAVPSEYFSNACLQLMDNEGYKYHMSTAKWLLFRLGSKDVRVSNFIQWLEEANLQKALVLLKKDVPIQITEQPPPVMQVRKGARLSFTCKARSYPNPEYQWFKGEEELLLQQEPELTIQSVKEEDAGMYYCCVTKFNVETNDISGLYSNAVEVSVFEESMEKPFSSGNDYLSPGSNTNSLPLEEESSLPGSDYSLQQNCNVAEKIIIVKQPYINGKVPQGMSICLHCKAKSLCPVKYQWYKDGRVLNGATSRKLHLNDLYPDQDTGDMKWEYFCEVSNECDKVFSHTATVELANANDTTPYYASEKYAFMIANDKYDNFRELKTPSNDVSDLGKLLESMKFKVFAYRNLTLTEMKNSFNKFCGCLKPNSYVLFYFAGHGFEQYGQMYLQPVDCSGKYQPQESICTEYILQCLQEAKPSLNILLIDACRNLPPQLRNGSTHVDLPGKIFEAKMKNNTFYGYSTPFLYPSHESDSEHNSFFVKYLKKYITHNKSIQEVMLHVQREFEGDPLVKGVQFPVIKSSLCGNRKLCDEIQSKDLLVNKAVCLEDIKGDFVSWEFELPSIKSIITLEMTPHLDIFINGIDITVSLYIEQNANLMILHDLEVNLLFNSQEISILPLTGIHLKNLDLKRNTRNMVLKKQVFDVQKVKGEKLKGKLFLKFSKLKYQQEKEFIIKVEKISQMKLSENYLGSSSVARSEINSYENNLPVCSLDKYS